MNALPSPVRLHRAASEPATSFALVSVEPATVVDEWLVRIAFGPRPSALTTGTSYGPYAGGAALEAAFEAALAKLRSEGWVELAAGWDLLTALRSADPGVRCRAALRAAWRGLAAARGPLREALDAAMSQSRLEACVLVECAARLGDRSAIEHARALAAKQQLARRRSGFEALRLLEDAEGLTEAIARARERLPEPVREALDGAGASRAAARALTKAVKAEDPRRWGLIADTLYELGEPAAIAAARKLLVAPSPLGGVEAPHRWRYAKSVLRRAMLRRDAATFATLAHAIERAARTSTGTLATLKSGLDGKTRQLPVFRRGTQAWARRASWRYLRDLARWEPARYARHASELAIRYASADAATPSGLFGAYSHTYLLHRVLYGASPRFVLSGRQLRFRYRDAASVRWPALDVREESFPERWDVGREAYLRLLERGQLPEVVRLGLAGTRRHPELVRITPRAQLLALAEANVPRVMREAAVSLNDVRVDDARADELLAAAHALDAAVADTLRARFSSLDALIALARRTACGREPFATLAVDWLRELDWLGDLDSPSPDAPPRWLALLDAADAGVREAVATRLVAGLAAHAAARAAFAPLVLERLRGPEKAPGAHASLARVARAALAEELGAILGDEGLLAWAASGSASGRVVAAGLLGAHPRGLALLGDEGLLALAEDPLVGVREGAHALVMRESAHFERAPALLYALLESRWDDTRALALGALRAIVEAKGADALGLDGLIGLCDATHPEARALGRAFLREGFEAERLDADAVLFRLAEHPDPDMWDYALELLGAELRPGYVPLARVEGFVRAVLFDVRPSRPRKRALLDFLEARGRADALQAELVARVVGEVVRTETRYDRELFAPLLASLQIAFPEAKSPLELEPLHDLAAHGLEAPHASHGDASHGPHEPPKGEAGP